MWKSACANIDASSHVTARISRSNDLALKVGKCCNSAGSQQGLVAAGYLSHKNYLKYNILHLLLWAYDASLLSPKRTISCFPPTDNLCTLSSTLPPFQTCSVSKHKLQGRIPILFCLRACCLQAQHRIVVCCVLLHLQQRLRHTSHNGFELWMT